jgi:hypothetical protein
MIAVESSPDTKRPSSDFAVTRCILALMAGSFVITAATFQSLFSLLTSLLFIPLALAALLAGPVIIIENWNRKSLYYAAALLISIPAWLFGMQWIVQTGMEVNHRRARAFIAEVKDHAARTGTLPATEKELRAANIKLPSAILGFEMRYRLIDSEGWPFSASRMATGKLAADINPSAFEISFEAGVLVICTHSSITDIVLCDD